MLQLRNRLISMSNPSTFTIKEITIGNSTPDVLMHLSKSEISFGFEQGARMERLADHLLQQRRFACERRVNSRPQYFYVHFQQLLPVVPANPRREHLL